jgi:calcineurin-like phosphoesterase family protein
MANLLITSDFHLGHSNIIRYCDRPFKNVDEMDKVLIRNANSRVKEEDTVIHVGDFCFKNSPNGKEGEGVPVHSKNYIKQLNGRWVFIRGNHDRQNSVDTKIERLILKVGGIYINVCHRPDDAIIEDDKYYSLNLVGHVHNNWVTKEISQNEKHSLLLNVGCDNHKFYPYTFDEVKAIYDRWLHNHKMRKNINSLIINHE